MRRRRSSFYYLTRPFRGSQGRGNWLYTIVLFVFSTVTTFIFLFSSSFFQAMSDRFIDERLGFCQKYECSNDGKIAMIIPFKVDETQKVERLVQDLIEKTEKSEFTKRIDLYLLANGAGEQFKEKGNHLRKIVDETESIFNSGHLHYVMEFCQDDNAVLKYLFGEKPPTFLKDYCFIYFSSVDMKILKPQWAKEIILQSVDSGEANFWVKSPLDMSLRPFAYYENIEISLYSIYAVHSPCLKELFLFAADSYPSARVSKAFNLLMRDPSQLVLSHCIAPKIEISAFGVDMRNSDMEIEKVKSMFPDAYIAQGKWLH